MYCECPGRRTWARCGATRTCWHCFWAEPQVMCWATHSLTALVLFKVSFETHGTVDEFIIGRFVYSSAPPPFYLQKQSSWVQLSVVVWAWSFSSLCFVWHFLLLTSWRVRTHEAVSHMVSAFTLRPRPHRDRTRKVLNQVTVGKESCLSVRPEGGAVTLPPKSTINREDDMEHRSWRLSVPDDLREHGVFPVIGNRLKGNTFMTNWTKSSFLILLL